MQKALWGKQGQCFPKILSEMIIDSSIKYYPNSIIRKTEENFSPPDKWELILSKKESCQHEESNTHQTV